MKRARWSRPQPLKIIATVRRIANRLADVRAPRDALYG